MSIGGALAANAHGRGLRFKPMIADVESFTLVNAQGKVLTCSRKENRELFRLAIGGYGLFGVIAEVKLRLMPRTKLERTVDVIEVADLVPAVEKRIADGYMYGDFQFDINPRSEHFLTRGVFSTYKPVDPKTPIRRSKGNCACRIGPTFSILPIPTRREPSKPTRNII